MRIASCMAVALAALLAAGCYSSRDDLTGGDTRDAPDVPPEITPDTPWPDVPPDVPPDVYPDTPWPDVPPDIPPDEPWPDVPPDPTEPDAPPGGIVGDACSSWYECRGMPTPEADCWWDIMGYLRFPGGYCSAYCSSDWECGTEGDCVDLMFITMCLRTCDYIEDCRESEGYDCMDLPFVGGGPYCLPTG